MLISKHIRSQGFTLPELLIVLAVVAVLGIGLAQYRAGALRDARTQRTVDGIILIQEALYSYRLNPSHGYMWPAQITALNPYLPNFSGGGKNGIGQPYGLDLPSTGGGIVIETDMLSAEAANDVARLFPLNGAVVGTRVRVGTPVPGHEAARDAVLSRDGVKNMLGNLDLGGNDIDNAAELNADLVRAKRARLIEDMNRGDACIRKEIGTTAAGNLVECIGGVWTFPQASTLSSISSRVANLERKPVVTPPPPPPLKTQIVTKSGSYNSTFTPIPGFIATQCAITGYREISAEALPKTCWLGGCGCSSARMTTPCKRWKYISGLSVKHGVTMYQGQESGCKNSPTCSVFARPLSGTVNATMSCTKL